MDEKPEERDQELYYKLNSEYLIECAENERIDEWNAQYLEYLALEWNRLYHPREWGQKNILELVRHSHFRRPDFSRGDFREVTSRKVLFVGIPMDRAPLEGEPLEEKHLEGLHLEGAKFWQAHMEGAKFWGAHMEGAQFWDACMKGAKFWGAHMEEAEFWNSHLEGAYFNGAHLDGAKFIYAVVDGATMFIENSMDDKTDFTGTALSATRIDPNLRTRLERNIREIQWRKWYNKPKISPWGFLKKCFGKKEETEEEQVCKSSLTDRVLINPFVRLFWWLSDYGTSCKRCLLSFGGLIVLAFIVNLILTQHLSPDIAELFANTVLALFGVGDPELEGIARLWQVVYVISGYFLLAVLISRFAIMFQNMSP